MVELIHITAQYSNAVLLAVLPYVSDYARKLELPMPLPLTTNAVRTFYPTKTTVGGGGGLVITTNGYHFRFAFGGVQHFYSSRNYMAIGDEDPTPESFYGPVKIAIKDAISLARRAIEKLGYDLKKLGMHRSPMDTSRPFKHPETGKTVPFCTLVWRVPTEMDYVATMSVDVDCENAQVTRIQFLCDYTYKSNFNLGVPYETEASFRRRTQSETNKMGQTSGSVTTPK